MLHILAPSPQTVVSMICDKLGSKGSGIVDRNKSPYLAYAFFSRSKESLLMLLNLADPTTCSSPSSKPTSTAWRAPSPYKSGALASHSFASSSATSPPRGPTSSRAFGAPASLLTWNLGSSSSLPSLTSTPSQLLHHALREGLADERARGP